MNGDSTCAVRQPRRRSSTAAAAGDLPNTAGADSQTTDAGLSEQSGLRDGRASAGGEGAVVASRHGATRVDRLPLRTPAQAAQLLAVPESWLRRKAAARTIPCTFLGRHVRFSPVDLIAIATAAAHTPSNRTRPPRRRPRTG